MNTVFMRAKYNMSNVGGGGELSISIKLSMSTQ